MGDQLVLGDHGPPRVRHGGSLSVDVMFPRCAMTAARLGRRGEPCGQEGSAHVRWAR